MSKFTGLKVYSDKKTVNSAPFSKREHDMFCWGRIVGIHKIGDIEIIEFLDMEREDGGCISSTKVSKVRQFHVNGTCHSYHSLDLAIVGALAIKYDGLNTQADKFFARAVKIPMSF